MQKFLILLAFVSSCGPLKMDQAQACPVDNEEVVEMVHYMLSVDKASCDEVYDFLQDTALEHSVEYDCDQDEILIN